MIERTLALIKPDGIERKLIGEIISRFEKAGLKVLAIKMIKPTKEIAERHYPATDEQLIGMGEKTLQATLEETGSLERIKKTFGSTEARKIGEKLREWMIDFLTSGKVVAFVLEGEDAIQRARKLGGYTDPSKAEPGSIRGDLGMDSISKANRERRAVRNLVHLSSSKEEARRELKLWFPEL